jgi:hypothetical protein
MNDLSGSVADYKNLRALLLQQYPELAEDSATLLDTLESATDLDQQILAVLREARWREEMAAAGAKIIAEETARKNRYQRGAETLRGLAFNAMQEASLRRIVGPDMTATIAAGPRKVLIVDEDRLPPAFVKVERSVDRKALAAALKAGPVEGAQLGNGSETLTIRRS